MIPTDFTEERQSSENSRKWHQMKISFKINSRLKMSSQKLQLEITFALILYVRLFLEVHAVSDDCKPCKCERHQVVSCGNVNLTSVPKDIPTDVEQLYLQDNQIRNLKRENFENFPSLKRLNLGSNNIENIEQGTFDSLSDLKYLELGFNNIRNIEPRIFENLPNLKALGIAGNYIRKIEEETFQSLSSLLQLFLHKNRITTIDDGAFRYLSKLEFLLLTYNNITKIKAGMFQDLPNLSDVRLDYNQMTDIEVGSFKNLPGLTQLYLSDNNITKIKAGMFQDLPNLSDVRLNYNQMTDIEVGSFKNLPSLTQLRLDHSNIIKIKAGSFQDLPNLKDLRLDYNNITNMKGGIFQDLLNLIELRLNNNSMQKIENESIRDLVKLVILRLDSNNITNIEKGAFRNLPSLKHLYLSKNQIRKYDDGAFLFFPSIEQIDLKENNDMMCGCHLPAFVNYMNRTYNRTVRVFGECHTESGNNQSKVIPIMEYSQCKSYSLFQRNLQCQTCSEMMCADSEVRNCTVAEPVCQYKLTMNGVTLKFERSCSTYRNCLEAMRNNTFTCNKWINGTSCVACCSGNQCNKNDFIGWTDSFVFHLIYNSTFKNLKENPAENISRTMERGLSNLTGSFKVEYCGLEKYTEVVTIYCTVLRGVSKDQVWENIREALNKSQTLHHLEIQQRNMKLIDEMFCNADTTSTNNESLYWPITKIGTNVTIPCHANVATRYCSSRRAVYSKMQTIQYMTLRKCSPFTGVWLEPNMSQCFNTEWITRQLKNMTKQNIDKKNIEEFSSKLLNISQKSEYFKGEDIDLAVAVLEKTVPLIWNVSVNITLFSINNMINTPEKVLAEAEQSNRSVNRILELIEKIPEKISLESQQVTVLYSNLGFGAAKVEKDTFNGLVYGILYETREAKAKNMMCNCSYPDPQLEEFTKMDFISLPKSLLKHLKDEDKSSISSVSFFAMQDDKLYRIAEKSRSKVNSKINSHIIAAKIPNIQVTNLDGPVTISFNVIDENATNLQCVYWDDSSGQNPRWSTKGCNTSIYVPGEKVICSCNHLTSFAILKDVYQNEGNIKNSQFLSIISNIGCGISFVCLVLTVIIHVYSKNLWKLMASKILINLCISLAVTYLIFLVELQGYGAKITAVCKAVAALLHYFLLTSLMWMTVESLHIFLGVVVVFKTYQTSFMKRSSILVWGLPGTIVIITLAINYTNNYIRVEQFCWLSSSYFYAAFLAPVAIILTFNLTMFSLIICHLISMQHNEKFEHKTRKIRAFGIAGLFFLLGLSWVLAFFAFNEAAEVFKFLFVIFSTLQGMFIFIFYCLFKKDARDVLCLFLCKRKTWKPKQLRKNIKSSSSGEETEDKTTETHL